MFDTAADPATQLRWDPSGLKKVEKLTPGPLGQGARYRGTFKGLGTIEYEFAEYDRPRRFVHRTVIPVGEMQHIFTFESVGVGTQMTQEAHLKPNLLGRVTLPTMRMMLRNRFRTIGSELKQYMKDTSAPTDVPWERSPACDSGEYRAHGDEVVSRHANRVRIRLSFW